MNQAVGSRQNTVHAIILHRGTCSGNGGGSGTLTRAPLGVLWIALLRPSNGQVDRLTARRMSRSSRGRDGDPEIRMAFACLIL